MRTAPKPSGSSALAAQSRTKGESMGIVTYREDELPPLTPEEEAHCRTAADHEINYSDIPETTDKDLARSVRMGDYPTMQDALREASKLAELQRAGWTSDQLDEYRERRVRELQEQAATV
jgi:hypothetical protein